MGREGIRMDSSKSFLRYEILADEEYDEINRRLAGLDTLGVIKWAYQSFGEEIVYSCSFGAEGVVLIDLISKVRPDAQVVFLDTDFHFRETYELIDIIREKYPKIRIDMVRPELTPQEQAEKYGDELWKHNPNLCCELRKIQPLRRVLTGYSAWISGLRHEQSPTRAHMRYVNRDDKFGSIKICPLIHWTWEEIWLYIRTYQLPYNPLHDQGYPSIGCEQCTRPVAKGNDQRSGRWAGMGKTECGLHQ